MDGPLLTYSFIILGNETTLIPTYFCRVATPSKEISIFYFLRLLSQLTVIFRTYKVLIYYALYAFIQLFFLIFALRLSFENKGFPYTVK